MAVPYDATPDRHSEFASMRDSFYILMNLNQYKMKPVISMTREAEGLLRIALFSKELKLVGTRKTGWWPTLDSVCFHTSGRWPQRWRVCLVLQHTYSRPRLSHKWLPNLLRHSTRALDRRDRSVVAYFAAEEARTVPRASRSIRSPREVSQEDSFCESSGTSLIENVVDTSNPSDRSWGASNCLTAVSSAAIKLRKGSSGQHRSCHPRTLPYSVTSDSPQLAPTRLLHAIRVREFGLGMLPSDRADHWRLQQLCLHDFDLRWIRRLSALHAN